jgi:hypothetical protein
VSAMRRSRAVVRRGSTRKFVWARSIVTVPALAANSAFFFDPLTAFQTLAGYQLVGATVTGGHFTIQATQVVAGVTGDTASGVFGMRINEETQTLGAAQGPAQDTETSWFVWQPYMASLNSTAVMWQQDYRFKSSRIIHTLNESVTAAVQNTSTAAAQNLKLFVSIGIKLP